ncbi:MULTISPECIES: phage antirepressor KilAC domain-containing protein [Acinetobacter calcoaceticus/baumannii complex]|uniref:phage antirepressor KilAC domain-containing protein n=1 Tax=Acinetobacter calcoaceticus/baumannii complex TaxID=909768 RepID=UPI000319C7EA|nr:phage antirepressor KilAC domain-containing protein [Acinetobacter pittii]MCM5533148.1 phage antirepressor KilAC domain-containing protein [Acinetobacter pittii]MCQ9383103.1 phage antirepressor KilAC domain-containing protein [Acinetobacter pittii]MCR3926031.1 phage antirepressor KilAC domain-containing protein [Acinetobacter pittii]RZH25264.1 DNA-binding protein [Acinetobacter pittii]
MSNLNINLKNAVAINSKTVVASMSSQDIAELVQARHDNVKTSIERLIASEVIASPATKEMLSTVNNRQYTQTVYVFEGEQGKRDSIIVVAQLSPQFTAKLVDRWIELEQATQIKLPSTYKEALLALVVAEEEKEQLELQVVEQQQMIEMIQPKADVYDIISNSENTYTIRVAAKLLKKRPKDLTDWLLDNRWMYGRSASTYRPAAQHDRNHLILVTSQYGTQVRVTGKGLVWIARKLNIELTTAEVE